MSQSLYAVFSHSGDESSGQFDMFRGIYSTEDAARARAQALSDEQETGFWEPVWEDSEHYLVHLGRELEYHNVSWSIQVVEVDEDF